MQVRMLQWQRSYCLPLTPQKSSPIVTPFHLSLRVVWTNMSKLFLHFIYLAIWKSFESSNIHITPYSVSL